MGINNDMNISFRFLWKENVSESEKKTLSPCSFPWNVLLCAAFIFIIERFYQTNHFCDTKAKKIQSLYNLENMKIQRKIFIMEEKYLTWIQYLTFF